MVMMIMLVILVIALMVMKLIVTDILMVVIDNIYAVDSIGDIDSIFY